VIAVFFAGIVSCSRLPRQDPHGWGSYAIWFQDKILSVKKRFRGDDGKGQSMNCEFTADRSM